MALTRDFKETVNARVQRDSEFAIALLDEAISLFLNGEPETARLILRDIVNATVGFEQLAIETSKPSKSLHRMLSAKGNPTMDNLTAIFNVLRKFLNKDKIIVMSKKITGLEIINESNNIVAILVYITNESIDIKDVIVDSEIGDLEDIEDRAVCKWGVVNIIEEIEYDQLYIFAKVAVGQSAKDYDYWSGYEAKTDFNIIKENVKSILALKFESKQESDYEQQKLFNLDNY
ncbi:hypothetical protein [Nodularia sp. LEGE 04288]|uniref:helix-turn-helix domain-containing transcriptional regulator n=1 Tax=Nodularia sp. LEGE 04288 TaxID=1828639 RepID=UPI001D1013A6|nr:hypothetical protein [Nodularia sp. LEGE 04288]